MKDFVSMCSINWARDAPFLFMEASSSTRLNKAGSASPIMNASKKSENGAGFVTPHPPHITIGSFSVLLSAKALILPSSSMAMTSVIPSS